MFSRNEKDLPPILPFTIQDVERMEKAERRSQNPRRRRVIRFSLVLCLALVGSFALYNVLLSDKLQGFRSLSADQEEVVQGEQERKGKWVFDLFPVKYKGPGYVSPHGKTEVEMTVLCSIYQDGDGVYYVVCLPKAQDLTKIDLTKIDLTGMDLSDFGRLGTEEQGSFYFSLKNVRVNNKYTPQPVQCTITTENGIHIHKFKYPKITYGKANSAGKGSFDAGKSKFMRFIKKIKEGSEE